MKKVLALLYITLVFGCVKDESQPLLFDTTPVLANDIDGKIYIKDAIFVFAGNNSTDADLTDVFVVIEDTATDIKFYRTNISNVDSSDFYNYSLVELEPTSFFDDSMFRYSINLSREQWIIITYQVDDRIKISSPIRTRNRFQPTVFLEDITINQADSQSPIFNWDIVSTENNAFFFEIMSQSQNQILSKTFTNDNNFQYFNLNNITLNLSGEIPPELMIGGDYQFIIFDIDLNNWINTIYMSNFTVE